MSIEKMDPTPIIDLGVYYNNHLWIKREDLIPFSFGGNKARKAKLFFNEIEKEKFDCVVTYGSASSNHCRVVANECCRRNIGCYIIRPSSDGHETFNSQMVDLFGAKIISVPISEVHEAINTEIKKLRKLGYKPYFIEGGGHGNVGTEAYVQCYSEIKIYEKEKNVHFDYIFLASGTGTTQAGLVCGQLLNEDDREIIGISIARKNPRGRNVVVESINKYLNGRADENVIQKATIFLDDYAGEYGRGNENVTNTIENALKMYGIPLDSVYTGKAFWGMTRYLENVQGKDILFIHTGGTPLFFDNLLEQCGVKNEDKA